MKITAGDGAGPLQDLNFIGEVFAGEVVRSIPSGAIETVAGPTPAPGFSFELQPGESRSYVVTVVPRAVGRISLLSEIAGSGRGRKRRGRHRRAGRDPLGTRGDGDARKGQRRARRRLPPVQHLQVSVQVKNTSDSTTVTDIFVAGNPPIVIGPIENDLAHQNSIIVVPAGSRR